MARKRIEIYGYEDAPYDNGIWKLKCLMDGEIIAEKLERSFSDLLIDSVKFYNDCLEKCEYDSRFDDLFVSIEHHHAV